MISSRPVWNGYLSVFDLGSTNGTYLNGRLLKGQHELVDGDEIKIGDTILVFGGRR